MDPGPAVLEPTALELRAGDDQTGVVGTQLPERLIVYVEDQNGDPLAEPVPELDLDQTRGA